MLSNTSTSLSYGWVGGKRRLTEHQGNIHKIEMGARQYTPGLGRFLSVDPVEGGCANDYVYVFGDPVNNNDLNGKHHRWWHTAYQKGLCGLQHTLDAAGSIASGLSRDVSQITSEPGDVALTLGAAAYSIGVEAAIAGGSAAASTGVVVVGAVGLAVGVVFVAKSAISDCA